MTAPSRRSTGSSPGALIARIWHGVTPAVRAEEYTDYLYRTGVPECRISSNRPYCSVESFTSQ